MRINEIKKRPILAVIVLIAILAVYLNFHFKRFLSSSQLNAEIVTNSKEFELLQNHNDLSVPHAASKVSPQVTNSEAKESVIWVGDDAQNTERIKWLASRGWYDTSSKNKDDYKTYSRETLEQLANSGDLNALTLLVKGSKNPERKNLQTKAAVYGSTFALIGLMRTVLPNNVSSEIISSDQRHAMVLEGAAYAKVAEMRGDLWPSYEDHLKDIEDNYYKNPLTDEDRQAIITIANNIYADFESQRIALGLGKFDNTYPPLVRAYYKAMGVLTE